MTSKQISDRMNAATRKVTIKFETAQRIRELLDTARKDYGSDWDDDDVEGSILELVQE
jgi:hypothetical protein